MNDIKIETERLILREYKMEDIDDVVEGNYNKNNFLDTSNLSVNETLEEIEEGNKYFI